MGIDNLIACFQVKKLLSYYPFQLAIGGMRLLWAAILDFSYSRPQTIMKLFSINQSALIVGIDTLIACVSQKSSQLLSISTDYRKNVVAVGGHLGFQLP